MNRRESASLKISKNLKPNIICKDNFQKYFFFHTFKYYFSHSDNVSKIHEEPINKTFLLVHNCQTDVL